MDGLIKTIEKKEAEEEFSFKNYFVPLTNAKAITWIVVIGLIVYANMLFNGFVWDDLSYFILNPKFHTINLAYIFGRNLFNSVGQYRAVPALYFSILYTLFGNSSFFYHILQLTIHIINTVIIYLFFTRFLKKRISFFISLLFLVHPIQVESVSYIAASDNPLYFLFGGIALLISLKATLSAKRIGLISVLLFISLLMNETGGLFLLIILLYRFLFMKRDLVKLIIGSSIATVLYLFIRIFIGHIWLSSYKSFTPIIHTSLSIRLLNMPMIIFYYIKTFFFPINLAIDQQWVISTISFTSFYFPLIIDILFFVAIFLLGIYLYKIKKLAKLYLFFLFWFLFGLGLHLQIYPLDMTVADRWFYFSIVGILGMLGIGIESISISSKYFKIAILVFMITVLIIFSTRTIVRNMDWIDPITLYTHDIAISDNYDLETYLGFTYSQRNNYKEAVVHLKKSVVMRPYVVNNYDLAVAYAHTGNYSEAEMYYKKILSSGYLNYAEKAYENLTNLLLFFDNNYTETKKISLQGVKKFPKNAQLWEMLAISEYKLHNKNAAVKDITVAESLSSSQRIESVYNTIISSHEINLTH